MELVRREDGAFVAAELHCALKPTDLLLVERGWAQDRARMMTALLKAGVPRQQWPQSLPWDWSRKAPDLKLLQAAAYGLVSDGDWQGLMMTKTAQYVARVEEDKGKPLVYVDFLEVAPWNWRVEALDRVSRFKGVGSVLFREAVQQSIAEGFHGRIGLHSLPQAEAFYEGVCGMTRWGQDPNKEDLVYFEFSRSQAQQFLSEEEHHP